MVVLAAPAVAAADSWFTLSDPIDPGQLTSIPFGARSHWLQPWRSSLTTRSATALQDAIGINFNVTPAEADDTARLLADSGVRRVRLEIGWSAMSYADPSQIQYASVWATYIQAFRQYGLRPLILLNANSGGPGPELPFNLNLTAPAAAGATTVDLDAPSAAAVVPGLTGINSVDTSGYPMAAGVLITSVNGSGVATLSRPLPSALAAGPVAATTLRYAPFTPPQLADGSPNPRFEATMAGWLQYVQAVCGFVAQQYGSDDFDVEVWNELSFGSAFLNESDYYSPLPDPGATGDVDNAILAGTVNWLADPANGLTDVKVGDGFSNSIPWVSGASVPPGTAAIDHHPYSSAQTFPQAQTFNFDWPVDALGNSDYFVNGSGYYQDTFVPSYTSFFPEYYLTGIQTETLMRSLSPIPSTIYGSPFGADTHPPGAPAPANWITETNLDASRATAFGMPAADLPDFQAKTAMRDYLAYASEGAAAVDLYAVAGAGCCQLVSQSFLDAVDANPGTYPGDSAGGLVMQSVSRMLAPTAGAQPISQPRQLSLDAIASDNDTDVQFQGNGTAAYPPLYNRDVLTFFPFQVSAYKFVSAVYVMTRNLATVYTNTPAPGQTPYDMPPENFQLTIGNVDGAHATVALTDPLSATSQPATIVSRTANTIVVQLQATDSPRMLTIDDDPSNPANPVSPSATSTPAPVATAPAGPAPSTDASASAPAAGTSGGSGSSAVGSGSSGVGSGSSAAGAPSTAPVAASHPVASAASVPHRAARGARKRQRHRRARRTVTRTVRAHAGSPRASR
ncbi:MAG: hypothetical protein ABSH51_02290 [Solirubrobacteraceae bacterium]